MKITPLDIRKQDFSRSLRGYDIDEVEAFLQLVANQWQDISDELRRAKDDLRANELKLDHYRKVEEALEEALQTARAGARQTIENAERKAKSIVELAENRALSITHAAESERLDTRREAARYSARQHEIVAKMRAFLMSEMELLTRYEQEEVSKLSSPRREALVEAEITDEPVVAHENTVEEATGNVVVESDLDDAESNDEPLSSFVFQSEASDEEAKNIDEEAQNIDDDQPSWRVTPIITPVLDSEDDVQEEITDTSDEAGSDEIKKIRQILEDLEK
jgi:cell division initiation protein